jgi:hypothetical protein
MEQEDFETGGEYWRRSFETAAAEFCGFPDQWRFLSLEHRLLNSLPVSWDQETNSSLGRFAWGILTDEG